MKLNHTVAALIAGSAALTLALAGCSSDDSTAARVIESAISTATEATSEMEKSDAVVQLVDAYIKEKPADKGMIAIFDTLTNNADEDIKVSSFKLEGLKEGTKLEQYDTKDGKILEASEGLTIPANGELALEPDSIHFMIMDNDGAMDMGTEHKLVTELSSGSSITQDVEVHAQSAGEEDYDNDGDLNNPEYMGGGEMDHSGH